MAVKTPILAGNWKMNKGPAEAVEFFARFCATYAARSDRSIWIFPPALSLAAARGALKDREDIRLGVQNIHWEPAGAFTGELSAPIAAEAGATLALVGHSERRHGFGETDTETGRKVTAALGAGLIAVLCVGDTLEQRRGGALEAVLERQLRAGLEPTSVGQVASLVIAYEPVWAIGTGVTATAADASAAHGFVRAFLDHRYGSAGRAMPILYGGSVNADNAKELLSATGVGGLLVGGASLKPDAFARIAVTTPD
ncbi:MAG: triose-phosphate isomerase [Gemmatimonadetes bacterium]|nr:triose-phosphate isomerase [Gemmatimonadota bacterium]